METRGAKRRRLEAEAAAAAPRPQEPSPPQPIPTTSFDPSRDLGPILQDPSRVLPGILVFALGSDSRPVALIVQDIYQCQEFATSSLRGPSPSSRFFDGKTLVFCEVITPVSKSKIVSRFTKGVTQQHVATIALFRKSENLPWNLILLDSNYKLLEGTEHLIDRLTSYLRKQVQLQVADTSLQSTLFQSLLLHVLLDDRQCPETGVCFLGICFVIWVFRNFIEPSENGEEAILHLVDFFKRHEKKAFSNMQVPPESFRDLYRQFVEGTTIVKKPQAPHPAVRHRRPLIPPLRIADHLEAIRKNKIAPIYSPV